MTEALDVSGLKPYEISNRSMLFWGQVLLCAIEGTMLLILIAIYFYLRLSVDVWPPPGTVLPGVLLPTLALIPLAASGLGSYHASEAAKQNDRRAMIGGLALNLAGGIIFLLMRAFEWMSFTFRWSTDVHGTIVWTILFLHSLDVVADLLWTAVLIAILLAGRVGERQRLGVHVDSVIWYFLAAIWIPLYAVIYWGPRIVGNNP
jgi:cytochrome c oxidase subunit I+III